MNAIPLRLDWLQPLGYDLDDEKANWRIAKRMWTR